jgi:hypothetical protein
MSTNNRAAPMPMATTVLTESSFFAISEILHKKEYKQALLPYPN